MKGSHHCPITLRFGFEIKSARQVCQKEKERRKKGLRKEEKLHEGKNRKTLLRKREREEEEK